MKKLSLLLLVLAIGSAGLYGQMAIGTNFSISGDATATAGYDLDEGVFGFDNANSADIKIELVAKQSSKKPEEMMAGWYGSIELKDFQIVIDSDNEEDDTKFLRDDGTTGYTRLYVAAPEIVATLKNGPLFLKIFAAPDNKADLVAAVENDDPDDNDYMAVGDDDPNDVGTEINDGYGITLGYDTADLDLAVGVSSEDEFKVDGNNTQGPYAVSADLGVEVGPARLDISFAQGIKNNEDATPEDNDDDTGIGAKLTTTFGEIKLSGGADIQMTGVSDDPDTTDTNESMNWEAGANAMVELTASTSLKSDFIFSSVKDVATDVTVELTDKSGLVEDLDMSLKWGLFDISGGNDAAVGAEMTENDKSDLLVKGELNYHLEAMGGTLTPGTTVEINQLDGSEDHTYVGLEVRAVLKDAVPATEFGLKWNTERLVASGSNEAQQGTVSLWTTIKY